MTESIDPAISSKIIQALASYLKRDPASLPNLIISVMISASIRWPSSNCSSK